MFSAIKEAEQKLQTLLPKSRHHQTPTAELLEAMLKWSGMVWTVAEKVGAVTLSTRAMSLQNMQYLLPVYTEAEQL
jgi:hypothetical protein